MRSRIHAATQHLTPLQSLISRRWRPQWICQHRLGAQQPWIRNLATSNAIGKQDEKPYYVTTPIFYVNADPHVGHMYTMILADVLKRWQVLKGRKAVLLTGTDEHGMKLQRAAEKAGMEPQEFVDKGAEVFRNLAGQVGISNEIFIRTTDKQHKEGVEYAWQMLEERGHIYESKHEGWYSVSDETFCPASSVHLIVEPETGRKIMASVETGKEVEWTSEANYHFRLSDFREKLLRFYEENPDYIVPKARMDDVVTQVTAGLEDLSISRPTDRLSWGVRVPTDESQTIYVWLDALLNYATAVGYPFTPGQESSRGFPPNVQVVGKDIVRFHCIYWPAFLMALDLPIHKQVLTHAHWTLGKQKMAKSSGNGVNPFFALERFGIDPLRWYLIHQGGIADDADYDNSFIIEKYKKGLQGGLGNLLARILRGRGWDVERAVKLYANPSQSDISAIADEGEAYMRNFHRSLGKAPAQVDELMRQLLPNKALQRIMKIVYDTNQMLQTSSPWTRVTQLRTAMADTTGQELDDLRKAGTSMEALEAEIDRSIYLAAESLRLVGIMLQPFMPAASKRQLDMLGVAEDRRSWEWCQVGKDDGFGVPLCEIGKGEKGLLFPPLTSDF
ncbi:Putative aminoacyl-tRNA synthetase, class Ia, anticodon-binding, methionyl-tRNA synthetase [Septoria linicola]|uniref:Probable methionine--tRNA ligase, mitochondrial n=1 Tax=Septoria linicola TaxID=215465 RepID=A0A9Q9EP39_9PEZI|nr:Putative aminoacyl-tRNA synthetase, class Ia, anticodon-binding, methionyl-tRNA synthetase [Septoria linicola]